MAGWCAAAAAAVAADAVAAAAASRVPSPLPAVCATKPHRPPPRCACAPTPLRPQLHATSFAQAMMAFSGIVTQSQLTGGGFPYTYNGAVDFIPPLAPVNPIDAFGICSTGIINGCQ